MSRYENYSIKNNVHGSLYAPISSLSTTIQLNDGQGARFSTDMLATLESVDTTGKVTKREIVLITGISGDTLTVTRKYEPCPASDDANSQSQTSFSFDVGDTINVYITAEHLDIVNDGIKFLETKGNDRMKVLRAISGTSLAIDIMPGNFRCADDNIVYAGTTDQILADNATNYIMIDGTATLQISTTDRDSRYTRLAKVTTLNGEITDIEDWRLDTIGGNLGGLAIHPLTEKVVPASTDELVIADSSDSYNNKRITYANLVPSSIVIKATLGETLTAGSGQGAVYFGSDGKVYGSNVAGHNYCDGIILDSGNAGDSVRMIISGFVPDNSLTGTADTVHLAYTSGTTNTGYGDYIELVIRGTDYEHGALVKIGNLYYGFLPAGRGTNRNYLYKLYGANLAGGLTIDTSLMGTIVTNNTYYVTGAKGQYGNVASYSMSGCELGKIVPGGFIFEPKPREIMALGYYGRSSGDYESSVVQAKFDGHKKFAYVVYNSNSDYPPMILESVDNNKWGLVNLGNLATYNNNALPGFCIFDFEVKKGRYYKSSWTNSGRYFAGGIMVN